MFGNQQYNAYMPQSPSYQQLMPPPPSMSLPSMQTTQPTPQEQRRTNAEFIPVSSIQQAKEHIVQPNQMLYFMNNNVSEFYIKTADNFGTVQFKAFKFSEIASESPTMPQTNVTSEITRSEFDALKTHLNALEQRFEEINKPSYAKEKKNEPDNADDKRK